MFGLLYIYIFIFLYTETGETIIKDAKPSKRYYHSATVVGNHSYIFGGKDFNVRVNDLFDYNLEDGTCTLLKVSGDIPDPRGSHTAVYYKGSIYIFGGSDGPQKAFDEVREFDIGMFFFVNLYYYKYNV